MSRSCVCMCVRVFARTCVYADIYARIHTHAHVTYIYIYIYIFIYIYVCICIYIHMHIYIYHDHPNKRVTSAIIGNAMHGYCAAYVGLCCGG